MTDPQLPPELQALIAEVGDDLAMAVKDTATHELPRSEQLSRYLCRLVWTHNTGALADLRRPEALTEPRLVAANFSPEEEHRLAYEKVAFLFARFHAGRSKALPGSGSMGRALRRIGGPGGRGPKDPGATRLLDRLVASHELPLRHLQHAIERARACDVTPPSWARLADDLTKWRSPGESVAYDWARDFYTPVFPSKRND
ncbi:type I-E CRISPR-associated protein Cse2/CasB [Streptomyces sp. MNU77]|uniref:type I-E CRISPR-associated protein Cse2/CasB n=2 Tax=Streptomyces TaxID=1883 RepID=UPI000697E86C|nr:type I-E CRISPR-associated protein Cse2/CasB [Streptomyces sp. MNU77]